MLRFHGQRLRNWSKTRAVDVTARRKLILDRMQYWLDLEEENKLLIKEEL